MDPLHPSTHHIVQEEPAKKTPVVRGARACTVCRAAKMKCVGSEDGTKPCQRCKRANAECIFEKHRRGRKPGSKLSEASKMLRRLEKGLSSAKLKSQANDASLSMPYPTPDSLTSSSESGQYRADGGPSIHFANNELPPILSSCREPHYSSSADDDDEGDPEQSPEELYPAKLIRKENRNSFFQTILNPQNEAPVSGSISPHGSPPVQYQEPRLQTSIAHNPPAPVHDPISAGIMDENQAQVLWDLVFLRLNPFINLLDPALHSVNYVRSKSRFLFTTLLMAGAKFFKPECYRACQNLANEHALRSFSEGSKSVEVVQAFACMTYWKEPEDTRTWTYIGYACRMAVELGLNRISQRNQRETEFQLRERRNRERTYLVLFVHDRSLSMQTGRQWMLPEDELVKRSGTWHEGVSPIRPEDVILAALVHLRRIAAETMETTDVFCLHRSPSNSAQTDVNYEVLLRNCNAKLTQWQETWQREMMRAKGESFHHAFLNFFRLYVRLFLNSFGIHTYIGGATTGSPSLQALSACYSSALENLQIISKDFAAMNVLRYGQDSVTIMSAYCAIFLLKLLRSSHTQPELHPGATNEIYTVISQTADAYQDASQLCPASGSAAYHARFLRSLVTNDIARTKQNQETQDSRHSLNSNTSRTVKLHTSPTYPPTRTQGQQQPTFHQFPAASPHYSPTTTAIMNVECYVTPDPQPINGTSNNYSGYSPGQPMAADSDASYSRNLLKELGLEDGYMTSSTVMDFNAFHIGNGYSGFTPLNQQYMSAAGLTYVR